MRHVHHRQQVRSRVVFPEEKDTARAKDAPYKLQEKMQTL
jgi:hypothetical protein